MHKKYIEIAKRHPIFTLKSNSDLVDKLSAILFIAAFVLAIAGFITNLGFGHSFILNLPNLIIALMLIIFPIVFYQNQFLVSIILLYIVGIIYLPYIYFTNNAFLGAGPLYFIIVFVYFPFFLQGKKLLISNMLLILYYILLFIVAFNNQNLVLNYPDAMTGLIDNIIGVTSVGIIVTLVGAASFSGYLKEKKQATTLLRDLEKQNIELEKLTITDDLTQIYNRRYFMDRLHTLIKNNQEKDFYLMMIDIDDFKAINDTYGHLFGDSVLKKVALELNKSLRDYDLLARYGGEEFVVITSNAKGYQVAERMRKSIEQLTFRYEFNLTVSIGVIKYTDEKNELDLINKADTNLYSAKQQGKNKVIR